MRFLAALLVGSATVLGACSGSDSGAAGDAAAVSMTGAGDWQAVGNPRGNTVEVDMSSLAWRGDTVTVTARVITESDTIPRQWQIACESRQATREGGSGWAPIREQTLVGMIVGPTCEKRPAQ